MAKVTGVDDYKSMKDNMLDKVRRNNAIVIQTEFAAGIGGN